MARQKNAHLLQLARRGAEAEVRDLLQEAKYLFHLFPQLRDAFDPDELPVSFLLKRGARRAESTSVKLPARKGRMSPSARKAVSERMKKYWATRRKAGGKQ